MLSFSNAIGNIYNVLGKLGLLASQARIYQSAQTTNLINTTTGVVAQLNSESDLQALIGSSYINQLNSIGSSVGGLIQNVAQQVVNRKVYRDNPQISQNLQQLNINISIQEVIRQMRIAGATVQLCTVAATPGTFTGTGNGTIVTSVRRPIDYAMMENSFAENIKLTCTNDSYLGSATAGNEQFQLTGVGSDANVFAFNWPLGSNTQTSLSVIDGNSDNTHGNILTNSGFESWTANVPDNWDLIVGVEGTSIYQENTIVYDAPPNSSLCLVGDGSTLVQWKQKFNDSTGTNGRISPITQYAFNMYLRRDAVAAAAGVLTIDLVDENDVILQDIAGNNNSFTIDLTGLTTVFAAYSGVFRTAVILPDEIYIRIRETTTLTNGRSVYIDKASLGLYTQAYVSGPFVSIHAGSSPFVLGDYATVAVTNSRGAGGTLNTFQTLWARLFPAMYSNEFILPSSSTPTISDLLIG